MPLTTVHKSVASTNFDLAEKIELCKLLFKHKLYDECARKRTILSCDALKAYADQIAALGYFYSGKELTSRLLAGNKRLFTSVFFLTCVFCKYVHRVTSLQGKKLEEDVDVFLSNLKNAHDQESTDAFRCRMRLSNVPARQGYEKNNVHEVEYKSGASLLMQKLEPAKQLSSAEMQDPVNKWILCMVCREKEINVAFLPCGCALLCSSCLPFYRAETCAKCASKIEGYSLIHITT